MNLVTPALEPPHRQYGLGQGLVLDMKYHILHDFITFTFPKETSSDHFKDPRKCKPLTNFDVNITSSPVGIMN